MLGIFYDVLSSADFFSIFQEHYLSVKQFGFRTLAKISSRRQNLPLAGKEFTIETVLNFRFGMMVSSATTEETIDPSTIIIQHSIQTLSQKYTTTILV